MSDVLKQMIAQLSDEDKNIFLSLSEKLKAANGRLENLSESDLNIIQSMEEKYGEKINQVQQEIHNEQVEPELSASDILELPFAQWVRQVMARDLAAEYPIEEDAVNFIFENKWLPIDCQDESLSLDVYNKYQEDVVFANQWRESLVSTETDHKMALGLAWFMVIFQLHKKLTEV